MAQGDAAEQKRIQLGQIKAEKDRADLIRKRRKAATTTTTFKIPSVIKGVPHQIEGVAPITMQQIGKYLGQIPKQEDKDVLSNYGQAFADIAFNKKQRASYEQAIADFKAKQKARKRIKPIPDPEDRVRHNERRRQARKRMMGGRLGTMLTLSNSDRVG